MWAILNRRNREGERSFFRIKYYLEVVFWTLQESLIFESVISSWILFWIIFDMMSTIEIPQSRTVFRGLIRMVNLKKKKDKQSWLAFFQFFFHMIPYIYMWNLNFLPKNKSLNGTRTTHIIKSNLKRMCQY